MFGLNSKIYVAGHRGLVGSAIVRALRNKGYNNLLLRIPTLLLLLLLIIIFLSYSSYSCDDSCFILCIGPGRRWASGRRASELNARMTRHSGLLI